MPRNICCVVVEYLPGGALKSYLLKNRRKKIPFKVVIQLHSILQEDVKTENVLLDKTRTVKIADFGVARVKASNPNDMTGETGTLGYMAPEVYSSFSLKVWAGRNHSRFKLQSLLLVLLFSTTNGNPYNRKCDAYSFGICLWEIYCCDMSYPDLSFSEVTSAVVRQNLRPDIPRCCPGSLSNVMKQCWDANPDKRPEMDEVVRMLEGIDTTKGGGMIPGDQAQGCLCFRKYRGP
ncbi:putative dual-specificity kinase TKL-Pl-4 family [Helianthus anomalus]